MEFDVTIDKNDWFILLKYSTRLKFHFKVLLQKIFVLRNLTNSKLPLFKLKTAISLLLNHSCWSHSGVLILFNTFFNLYTIATPIVALCTIKIWLFSKYPPNKSLC